MQNATDKSAHPLPLTSFQKELWLANAVLPDGHPGLSSGCLFVLAGEPDPERLAAALRILLLHVPLLTATLDYPADTPLPHILPGAHGQLDFRFVDLAGSDDPLRQANEFLNQFVEQPFQPIGGVLSQFALLRLGDRQQQTGRSWFLMRLFHLLSDGVSLLAHFNLLAKIYASLGQGTSLELGEPCDWASIAEADQAYAESPGHQRDKAFWATHLQGLPTERLFPPLPGRPDRLDLSGQLDLKLSPAGLARLDTLAAHYASGRAPLLMALHGALLARLFDRQHLSIQQPLSLGERKDIRRMHGLRVAVSPIHIEFAAGDTLAELLRSLRQQTVALLRHGRTPFQNGWREGEQQPTNAGGQAAAQAIVWDCNLNYFPLSPDGGDGDLRVVRFSNLVSRHEPIAFGIYALEEKNAAGEAQLQLFIVHSLNHWRADDVHAYVERLEALLEQLAKQPELPVDRWTILLPHEVAQLARWQEGEHQAFAKGSIPELFDRQAALTPDAPAVVGVDGQTTSYQTLCRRSDSLAQQLREQGVATGEVVAVLARRHAALAECILGIMKAGGVYLPVDPDYPPARQAHMLSDSGARRLLALSADDAAAALRQGFTLPVQCLPAGQTASLPTRQTPSALPQLTPEQPAYLIYTSGSTGLPKGVLLRHDGFVNMIQGQIAAIGIKGSDRVLQFASPSFDASLSECFIALLSGASLHPVPRQLIDAPWALKDHLAAQGITIATLPPSYLALFRRERLASLRVLITAGEAPVAEDARHYAGQLAYINAYGPTEFSVCASLVRLQPETTDGTHASISIGRPLPNTAACILDSLGEPVAPGLPGELCLGGIGLAIGYLNRPALNAERFFQRTGDERRWYRTGDRARWLPTGEILLLGRNDDQVKIRGQRVELGEIGSVLERHPQIIQACVLALPSAGGSNTLVAFLISHEGPDLATAPLIDWLRHELPDFALPARYHVLTALPATPAGKVDRQALAQLDATCQRSQTGPDGCASTALSSTAEMLREHYEAVLGSTVNDPEADFFALGGDSLKAMTLVRRLALHCGLPLSVREFLAASTLTAISRRLEQQTSIAQPASNEEQLEEQEQQLPLNQGQLQLWMLYCLNGPGARYNMPLVLDINADTGQIERFIDALRAAIDRQPACRCTIAGDIDAPHFVVQPSSDLPLERHDFLNAPATAALIDEFIHRPFMLDRRPPIRLGLFALGEQHWQLALVMHHIIGDGESLALLLGDALAQLQDPARPRAALPAGMLKRYTEAEQAYLNSPAADADLAFWQQRLTPLPPRLNLLPPATRQPLKQGVGGTCLRTLPARCATQLGELASQAQTSLLAAFVGLLGAFLQQRSAPIDQSATRGDIAIAVPIGLRDTPECFAAVGYFVNTVVLRLTSGHSPQQAIHQAGTALRAALTHGRYPFHRLPAALQEVRDAGRSPLVDVLATQIDQSALLADATLPDGMTLRFADIALRAAKFDYGFILLTRADGALELLLEYDLAVTDATGAAALLDEFANFLVTLGETLSMPPSVPGQAQPEPFAMDQCGLDRQNPWQKTAQKPDQNQPFEGVDRNKTPLSPENGESSPSAALARAWREVLGAPTPTETSNFFQDGGDSIKAIQLVGLLRRFGHDRLLPSDFFALPTFGELCAHLSPQANPAKPAPLRPAVPAGSMIPLLPLQRDFIARHPQTWMHFHLALPLRLAPTVDENRLSQAIASLPARHEAFRLQFSDNAAHLLAEPAETLWLVLQRPANESEADSLSAAAQALFAALNPQTGRCFGACLVCRGTTRLLLIGGHHFVLDAVSLDLLRAELTWYCENGQWPAGTTGSGFATWAEALISAAAKAIFPSTDDKAAWQQICAVGAGRLAALRDLPAPGTDKPQIRLTRRISIDGFSSEALAAPLRDLLAALAAALQALGQTTAIFVTLEGHGRQPVQAGLDVSQSVGWFTAAFPLRLQPSADTAGTARALTESLASLPHGGLSYAFAALDDSTGLRGPACIPQISLNYLGRLLAHDETTADFLPLPELATPDALPDMLPADFRSSTPLDLLACIDVAGRLQLSASFTPAQLDEAWIAQLLQAWATTLRTLRQAEINAASPLCAAANTEIDVLAEQCAVTPAAIVEIGRPDTPQIGMLFQHLLDSDAEHGGEVSYRQQINFRLHGVLNTAQLADAWRQLLRRHASLRTLFARSPAADDEFVRVVLGEARTTVSIHDLGGLPATQQLARRDALLTAQREAGFNLATGPLLHLQVFRYADDDHEMSWCFHHLLMDGWCIGILLRELFTLLAAAGHGQAAVLPAPPTLAAYRHWRMTRDDPAQPLHQAAADYWRALLADLAAPTPIAAPAEGEPGWQEIECRLAVDRSEQLRSTAAGLSATLPQLLQALWGLLLAAVGGARRDQVFGLVSAGRPAEVADIERTVGLFIQTLPVRLQWSADSSLADLVATVRRQAGARAPHEFMHLADIQRLNSNLNSNPSAPLFDHILIFENYPVDGITQAGAPSIVAVSGIEHHPYALGVSVIPDAALCCRFSARSEHFTNGRLTRLIAAWQDLLETAATNHAGGMLCDALVGQIATQLTGQQRPATVDSFNQTSRPYPRNSTVNAQFCQIMAEHPAQIAVIAATDETLTYRQLDQLAERLARHLPRLAPGEPVALLLPRGPAALIALLGILRAGGCYLPLDAKNPPQRLRDMLHLAACRYLIHDATSLASSGLAELDMSKQSGGLLFLEYTQLLADTGDATDASPWQTSDKQNTDGEQPAYIMFTSGSTGEPKGVVVPQRGILRLVCNSDFWQLHPGERVLQAAPLGFDASTLEIWGALLNAGTVCFIDDEQLLAAGGLSQRIARGRISRMWLTASLCSVLTEDDPGQFAPLRTLLTGGEALNPAMISRIMAACPALEIFNGYGPTENTTFTTVHRITPADLQGPSIPIGRPIANTRVHIINEHGALAGIGEWGEICAAGDGLALGYIGREALTRSVFVELPGLPGERVYRTGDIGRWRADGCIEFHGRRDGQVKIRGYRIEPGEIENALRRLPGVRQAAVVAVGEGVARHLVGFIDGEADSQGATALAARNALASILPAYMLPDRIECLAKLPLTVSGKVDRMTLVALAEQGQGANTHSNASAASPKLPAPAGSELEQQIAAVFAEVLGLPSVDRQADFFALGGQSLKAMRLMARLTRVLGVTISLREVMTHTTVATLAAHIAGSSAVGLAPSAVAAPPAGHDIEHVGEWADYPLSSGQERLLFLQRMHPDSTAYHVPFAARVAAPVDAVRLQAALSILEARHDALRLRMPSSVAEDGPRQSVAAPGALRLVEHDLRGRPDATAALSAAIDDELAQPFTFGRATPLVRAHLFRMNSALASDEIADGETNASCENEEWGVLLLVFHHLICDGWSGEIFLRELGIAGKALTTGGEPRWPALPVRYVDYAVWQQRFMAQPACETLRARWLARLAQLPEPLRLPLDKPRPALRSQLGGFIHTDFSPARHAALRAMLTQLGGTPFRFFLTLVHAFLYRHSGQSDLIVGVPVAGREHAAFEDVLGFFVNTLPLRLDINPGLPFTEAAATVGRCLQEALDDQACPLETLLDRLKVARDLSRNPLFDVIVAFEGAEWGLQEAANADGAWPALRPWPLPHRQSKVDLSFYFREREDGLSFHIEYASDLFESASIERMAERLLTLFDAVLADPQMPLRTLALLPAAERECVVEGFNRTDEAFDLTPSIDALFHRQAALTPDAVALRGSEGGLVDFAGLNQRVEALAQHLLAAGVLPGRHVGVCFERSVELMTAIFAVLRVGGVYVPIVPGLPPERIRVMLEDLGDCLVLCAEADRPQFEQLGVETLVVTGDELAKSMDEPSTPPLLPIPPIPADAAAYVIFTSGSTGRPKGVVVEHRSVVNRLRWMQSRFPLTASDVILQKTPISFDVSVWELFWWSWYGASLAQLAPGEERDPAAIVAAIARHRASVMHFVPSMLTAFLDHLESHPDAVDALASLRLVFASGEALTPETVVRFNRLLHARHGSELHNLYGPTEATVDVSWYPCSPLPAADSPSCSPPTCIPSCIPIGRPIANTRFYILDAAGQPVPIGVTGELFISGIQVARGYINRPELTAERFATDPFRPGSRMYRSGDLARWLPTGEVEYLGRCDDQVKIRGFRIELGEVEAALQRCPGVAQAIVRVGSVGGMPALEAFLLPLPGQTLAADALRARMREIVPDYMCPAVWFALDSVPLGSSGKADRKALQGVRLGVGLDASAASGENHRDDASAAPATVLQKLRDIWSILLPEACPIGIDQNFFDIGGSSLLLLRLHEALEKHWPGCFSLPELFVSGSIRLQAARIAATGQPVATPSRRTPTAEGGPIAIIGMALRLADYEETDAFWSDLLTGSDRTVELSPARRREATAMLAAIGVDADPSRFRTAAYLDEVSGFDCRRFSMAPGDARLLDPEQRLFLETAARALEDAGYGGQALYGAKVGVFAGASPVLTFREAIGRSFPEAGEQAFILNVPSNMATRLGYLKNWDGPAALVDTACSSTLKAVADAVHALRRGDCDLAVVGGARVLLTPLRGDQAFSIETTSGRTRTFDAGADGVGAGEGAVVFLLKPLAQAQADGDAIHAVLLGAAVNQDGRSAGIAAPNPAAQARVIRAAADDAGLALSDIDFFEAHGTATALGDPIEIDGLTRAFAGEDGRPQSPVPIGSVKGNFGHLDSAAGAIGLAKVVLALQHGQVPCQPYFERPNPKIDFAAAPVHVADRNIPLPKHGQPWRAGISAFGLSGINVHLILEQPPQPQWSDDDGSWYCLPLSAGSENGLCQHVNALLQTLARHPAWPLQAIAATLILGREPLPVRAAFIARDRQQFINALLTWRLGATESTRPARNNAAHPPLVAGGLSDEAAAQRAAAAFLSGADLAWPAGKPTWRVHLPTVPMERQTCWPEFIPLHNAGTRPWLGPVIETPLSWLFPVPAADARFWPAAEHRLAGEPTLVGMAVPALIAAACAHIPELTTAQPVIRQLAWLRPLGVAQVEPASLTLELRRQDEGFAVSLSGRLRGDGVNQIDGRLATGDWCEFAMASLQSVQLASKDAPPPVRLDPDALRTAMTTLSDVAQPKGQTNAPGLVEVGERWQCRRRAWRSADGLETLAWLVLPDTYAKDLVDTDWHPALLDVGVSLALDRPGLVPAGCALIRLHRPLTARLYAHARRRASNAGDPRHGQAGVLHADCSFMAEDGTLLAEFIGLAFVPLPAPRARLHRVEWQETMPVEADTEVANPTADGAILVIGKGQLADALCDELARASRLSHLSRYTCLPDNATARAALAEEILKQPVLQVLHLANVDEDEVENEIAPPGWPLAALLQTICRQGLARPLQWISFGCGGAGDLLIPSDSAAADACQPEAALALGLLLSLNHEEPLFHGRYVELRGPVSAADLLAEAQRTGPDGSLPVLLQAQPDSQPDSLSDSPPLDQQQAPRLRRLQRTLSAPVLAAASPIEMAAGTCVLWTGGLGGIALTLAEAIMPTLDNPAVLLHRGEFPPESAWDALAAGDDPLLAERAAALCRLRDQGVKLHLRVCDLTSHEALAATLKRVRQEIGPIGGIVHTAGVPGGGFLIGKSAADFAAVLAPRLAVRHLHTLTLDDPLRFFVLAASRTALAGAAGQTDYCAANAFLDAFACWRQATGRPTLAIDWNTWEQVGMAARLGAVDPRQSNLPPAQAGELLLRALASGAPQLVVSMPGETLAAARIAAPNPADTTTTPTAGHDPRSLAERVLQAMAEGLGYDRLPASDDDFYALGGDSITGLRIVNRLKAELGCQIGLADLFSHSRLADFIAVITERLANQNPVDKTTTGSAAAPSATPVLDAYPVSVEQLAVLQAESMAAPHTGYNLPQFLQLSPSIDSAVLAAAIKSLIARHEILRTQFIDLDTPAPRMRIVPRVDFQLVSQTLERLDAAAIGTLVRPFRLDQAPLFRASQLQLADSRSLLFFDIHHALADARAVDILLAELFTLATGGELPPLTGLQQKDAAWLQQLPSYKADEAAARNYWLPRFAGPLPKLNLPADHPRPPRHTHRGATAGFIIPADCLPALRRLARQYETTSHVLMLSLWAALLGQRAGSSDLVMAVAVDGRDREDLAHCAGMFASLLPLRLQPNSDDSFATLLRASHRHHVEALRHRSFPLNRLLAELRPPLALDRTPLAEVTFSYMNFNSVRPADGGFVPLPAANPSCKADLAIFASDGGDRLSFALEYYADLFTPDRIAHLAEDFLSLLDQVLNGGSERPLGELFAACTQPSTLSTGYVTPQPIPKPPQHAAAPSTRETLIKSVRPELVEGLSSENQGLRQAQPERFEINQCFPSVLAAFRQLFGNAAIGPDDSFFDLGGHSLLGLQIVNQLARQNACALNIRDLFDHPTPATLAAFIASATGELNNIGRVPDAADGCYPLSHAQQRLYVLHHTEGGATAYNMPFAFRVSSPLDTQALQRALVRLCARHETLRTGFVEADGQLWQTITPVVTPEFVVDDLRSLGESGLAQALTACRADAARPFNLAQAPLLRLRVCQLADGSALLMLVMHHIIGDGWSMQIFFGEWLALYADENAALPPLPIQYRDYAVWQAARNWSDERSYWTKQLQDAPSRIALPPETLAGTPTSQAGIVIRILPAELLLALRQLARNKGVSLAILFLTLFMALLYRLTRQSDLLIGMGVAGRERQELEGLIGFFVNILPIRVQMDDETELDTLLDRVHHACLEALARQDYPFDRLVRETQAGRERSSESLVNVMFEYQRYSDLQGFQQAGDGHKTLSATPLDLNASSAPAKYDLTLFVQDEPDACRLKAEFDPRVLSERTVTRWLAYLEQFLRLASGNRERNEEQK